MPSPIEKERRFRIAFALDESVLRGIDRVCREKSSKVDYTLHCSDNTKFSFDSVEHVISFPNHDLRRITALHISTAWSELPRISVGFRSEGYLPVSYTIIGEERDLFFLSDQLEQQIGRTRQWYTPFVVRDFVLLGLGVFLFLILLGNLYLFSYVIRGGVIPPSTEESATNTAYYSGGIVVIFIGIAVLEWIKSRVFPVATFRIGDGIKRDDRLSNLQKLVIGGFIVNVLAGVFLLLF